MPFLSLLEKGDGCMIMAKTGQALNIWENIGKLQSSQKLCSAWPSSRLETVLLVVEDDTKQFAVLKKQICLMPYMS